MKRVLTALLALALLFSCASAEEQAEEEWKLITAALAADEPDPVPDAWRIRVEMDALNAQPSPDPDVMNILLLSTDAEALTDDRGRSDLMMLYSVHLKTGRTKLISLPETARVTPAGLPDAIQLKYVGCFGGPLLTAKTINEWLALDITRYCVVNEPALIQAVDWMGGVTLPLTDTERDVLGITDSAAVLNGEQALRFVRLRRAGNTWERPRRLLEALLGQALSGGMDGAFFLVQRLIPAIDTNLTTEDVVDLLFALLWQEEAPAFEALSMPCPDSNENGAEWLRQTLYGEP